MNLARWLEKQWYSQRRPSPALWLLLPLHFLFITLSGLRRLAYRRGWLASVRLNVPVLVVGNLVVGGTGKTPLVLWLVEQLQQHGWHPGIISRGYGRRSLEVQAVRPDSAVTAVGDEPLLMARQSRVPLWVGRDRVLAGQALLAAHSDVDVLIADDGMQHYRLARDIEIALFDERGDGNGWRLPIGPLREPLTRLDDVFGVVFNGEVEARLAVAARSETWAMRLVPGDFYALHDPAQRCNAATLRGRCLHAVAGIGNPERFFRTLAALGLEFVAHPLPDHHVFTAADLDYGSQAVILMTEKDAVKCGELEAQEVWVLPVEAHLPTALLNPLLEKLNGC